MRCALFIIFLFVADLSFAQSKKEQKLLSAIDQLHKAMISGDRTALENIASAHLSYGHSGGAIENKEAFVEKIASGKSDFISINTNTQTIDIIGKTAIVRHILEAETNDSGKPASLKLKVLLVWQKEGGVWKLLARQAVKLT